MFRKVLIANRGEIAVRVAQAVQELGARAVAVFSEADRRALHVAAADEAHALEGQTAGETYLDIHKIIEAAQFHGADAVHPGYGFLSENAAFAQACRDAGLTFIGPGPDAIAAMGDKIIAKRTMEAAGVPVVPGSSTAAEADIRDVQTAAEQIGYPVLLKAAAGGGGKGMRIVRNPNELEPAFDAARREAGSAFGDTRVFLEKYIDRPRHIEFQIFGDTHGNVVHLFERECSIQRRYQKIVEESPSVALTSELRAEMGAAAVRAARALNYTNAGTVEFIVDSAGHFYFLEVNTRLQVEHPVTEMVVNHDLVRAQLLIAAGEPLPFQQDELRQTGHSIECRIYAEDPARGFLPSTGEIRRFVPPSGPNIRVDTGVRRGSIVSVHYDPMLAKLVVWGRTRNEAIARMAWALERCVVLGVTTNIEFLRSVILHPEFQAGRLHTHFLEENPIPAAPGDSPDEVLVVAGLAVKGGTTVRRPGDQPAAALGARHHGPWRAAARWRNT